MTFKAGDEDLRLEGEYVKLENGGENGDDDYEVTCRPDTSPSSECDGGLWWWWARLVVVLLFAGVVGAVFFKWVGPFLINKEVIPFIFWEREKLSTTKLAILVFASLAIFPSILLPSSPSMWIAGMTFGYCYGFLLTIVAVSIGVSVPYFIGSLFNHKIQAWLDRYPKKASVIRLAGEGSLFNQFRAVALIRISPFPYIIFNYSAVATGVQYRPYLLGTLVGMVPEIFLTLYTGILIKTLADATHFQHSLSATEIICNVSGFLISAATTVIVTIYAKRRLLELQMDEGLVAK